MLHREIDDTGPGAVEVLAVEGSRGTEGASWQILEKCWEKDQLIQGMWEYVSLERAKAKKFRKDAEKEKQEGIQGQWQQESLSKGFLEQAPAFGSRQNCRLNFRVFAVRPLVPRSCQQVQFCRRGNSLRVCLVKDGSRNQQPVVHEHRLSLDQLVGPVGLRTCETALQAVLCNFERPWLETTVVIEPQRTPGLQQVKPRVQPDEDGLCGLPLLLATATGTLSFVCTVFRDETVVAPRLSSSCTRKASPELERLYHGSNICRADVCGESLPSHEKTDSTKKTFN